MVSRLTPPPLAGANFTSHFPTPEVVFIVFCAWCTRGNLFSDLPTEVTLGLQLPPNGALTPGFLLDIAHIKNEWPIICHIGCFGLVSIRILPNFEPI